MTILNILQGIPRVDDNTPTGEPVLTVSQSNSPFINIYLRVGDDFIKQPNPTQLPTGSAYFNAWSPNGRYLAVGSMNTPFFTMYKRTNGVFEKLSTGISMTAATRCGAFSPDGKYFAVGQNTTPYVRVYSRNGDTFTLAATLDNPVPTSTGLYGLAFTTDGKHLVIVGNGSLRALVYKIDDGVFTYLSDVSFSDLSAVLSCAYSNDDYLALGLNSTPFMAVYRRDGDMYTRLPNPTTLPTGAAYGVAFSPDNKFLAVTHNRSPFLSIYKRNGDTLEKIPNLDVLPTAVGVGVTFDQSSKYLSVGFNAAPYLYTYKIEGDTFTKLPEPDIPPTNVVSGISHSPYTPD